MPQAHRHGLILLFAMFAVSCVSRVDIEEIKQNQKDILKKLDGVSKGGPAKRPQRPRGPDANKTYAFPAGDSHAKGPGDAWVTVIEVSDFQ